MSNNHVADAPRAQERQDDNVTSQGNSVVLSVVLFLVLFGLFAAGLYVMSLFTVATFLGGLAMCLVALAAVTLFPNLVVAAPGSVGASITLMSAASSDTSLAWMTGIACVGVPLVLAYHVIAYRVFRGRLNDKDVNY